MAQKLEQDLNIIQNSGIEIKLDLLTEDLNIIQALDDEPNDVGGLSSAELKAKFDEAGNAIKNFINDSLIPQVLGADATEAQREANEQQRQANEAQRQENETQRQANEAARQEAAAALNQSLSASVNQLEEDVEAAEAARNVWEDYDPAKTYAPGNKVYYLGSSYVNTAACQNVLPTVEANWQMIAKKGADGGGGLSPEEGDLRYLKLEGGVMTGPVQVLDPALPGSPIPLGYLVPASISVTRLPDRTVYEAGEAFQPGGMAVTAKDAGGGSWPVTDWSWEPGTITENTEAATVSLGRPHGAPLTAALPFKPGKLPYALSATLPYTQSWGPIASGGGTLVAAPAEGYNGGKAAYSEDGGRTWLSSLNDAILHINSSTAAWTPPVYGGGNWILISTQSIAQAAYSEDGGKTWASGTGMSNPPSSSHWNTPVYSGGSWVVSAYQGYASAKVMVSKNGGKTWAAAALPVSQKWQPPVYGGGLWIMIPYETDSAQAAYSEDGGETWEALTLPAAPYYGSLAYGGGVWIIASTNGKSLRSEDGGETWEALPLLAGHAFTPVVYGGGVWIMPPSSSAQASSIQYSGDGGETWETAALPVTQRWAPPACGGGVWVFPPYGGYASQQAAYSEDGGETWGLAELPVSQKWGPPAYGGGLWVMGLYEYNSSQQMAYSADGGKTWEALKLPASKGWGTPVCGGGGWAMAVRGSTSAPAFAAFAPIVRALAPLPGEEASPAAARVPPVEAKISALLAENAALAAAVERGLSL